MSQPKWQGWQTFFSASVSLVSLVCVIVLSLSHSHWSTGFSRCFSDCFTIINRAYIFQHSSRIFSINKWHFWWLRQWQYKPHLGCKFVESKYVYWSIAGWLKGHPTIPWSTEYTYDSDVSLHLSPCLHLHECKFLVVNAAWFHIHPIYVFTQSIIEDFFWNHSSRHQTLEVRKELEDDRLLVTPTIYITLLLRYQISGNYWTDQVNAPILPWPCILIWTLQSVFATEIVTGVRSLMQTGSSRIYLRFVVRLSDSSRL